MIEGLIALLIVILVVAIIGAVLLYAINLLPIEPNFIQILRAIVLMVCVLIIILRALPLLQSAI